MRRTVFLLMATGVATLGWAAWRVASVRPVDPLETVVVIAPLKVQATYEGTIESREMISVASRCEENATIVELAPEGALLRKGDILARFGTSRIERDILKLGRDVVSAQAELEILHDAKQRIEARSLEADCLDRRADLATERQALEDTRELARENLVPREEVEKHALKVQRLEAQAADLEQKLVLTTNHVQPAALRQAESALASAEQALALARRQELNYTLRAPSDGIAVYVPLNIGSEFRTARVGDTIFENQPFMMIPDLTNLVLRCYLPEAELSKVQEGQPVTVEPVSSPGLALSGRVESVASMAQPAAGRPDWQRFFRVTVSIPAAGGLLRPGLTAYAHVTVYENPRAVVVPRLAVSWREGKAYVKVRNGPGRAEERAVVLGPGDATTCEVRGGLRPGERVLRE